MMTRAAKILLLSAVAFFYSLVIFNNLTDYESNAQFVRHVLRMDTTLPGNHGMWRAISSPAIYTVFYLAIIGWEIGTDVLLWWGVARLLGALRRPAAEFHGAKSMAVLALTTSMLMWFVAFTAVGGEWFLMWQSRIWNGQEAAFRNFGAIGIVFLILMQPEGKTED